MYVTYLVIITLKYRMLNCPSPYFFDGFFRPLRVSIDVCNDRYTASHESIIAL